MDQQKQSRLPLTLAIITLNEEKNIERCIRSAPFCSEILIVDSGSRDKTREIAQKNGARVIDQAWLGFGPQKNLAAKAANNDWILSLDADEELSPEAQKEIQARFSSLDPKVGYQFPRISRYMNKWIRFGGWYPDRQLRLYHRQNSRWSETQIHEKVLSEKVETFQHPLRQYVFENIFAHVETNNRYSSLLAEKDFQGGRRFHLWRLLIKPPVKFLETYFLKLGFLDGLPGFVISVGAAYSIFIRVLKVREIEISQKNRGSS